MDPNLHDGERLGPGDRTVLVTDVGRPPMQVAGVLDLDPSDPPSPDAVRGLLAERIPRVPRLAQRLAYRRTTPGPVWVDDPGFELQRHLSVHGGSAAGDRASALDPVLALLCRPLDRNRPLWRALMITDGSQRVVRLAIVLHHVLADGVAGLAALHALTDAGTESSLRPRPNPHVDPSPHAEQPRPGLVAGLTELRLLGVPRLAPRISLTRPTGPHRRATVVRWPLAEVLDIAHSCDGTVNDVLLTVVTGALLQVLRQRDEHPGRLVVSVPVAGSGGEQGSGNQAGVRLIEVPALAEHRGRLRYLTQLRRGGVSRSQSEPVRAPSAVPLHLAFRALARVGAFGWFINHQRLVHTFLSNLRGPSEPLYLGGHRIERITPLSVTPGNVAVSFTALSYAGQLSLSVVTDPDACPVEPVAAAAAATFDALQPAT